MNFVSPEFPRSVACARGGGVAVAFDGNHVQGTIDALLVAPYVHASGQILFATGVVDGAQYLDDTPYYAAPDGTLQSAADAAPHIPMPQ